MKKIITVATSILIVLTGSAYKSVLKIDHENQATGNIDSVALNGVSKKIVNDQMKYFAEHKNDDQYPGIVSVWFDRKTIEAMVNLLNSECKTKHTDGVRIYFVSDPKGTFLTNSLVLVSTYSDISRHPNQSEHRDYYDHDLTNCYFSIDPKRLAGERSIDNCKGGALLYKKNYLVEKPCVDANDHYVGISTAEKMVMRYRDTKQVINTISEWFDLGLFELLTDPKNDKYDGIRIYFSRRRGFAGVLTGRNSFLITTTVRGDADSVHKDDFSCLTTNPFLYRYNDKQLYQKATEYFDKKNKDKGNSPPFDNGELCPKNCN